jgi:hypothetical protein
MEESVLEQLQQKLPKRDASKRMFKTNEKSQKMIK